MVLDYKLTTYDPNLAKKIDVTPNSGGKLLFEPGLIKAAENEDQIGAAHHDEIIQETILAILLQPLGLSSGYELK